MLLELYCNPSSYRSVLISPEYLALDHRDVVENGVVSRKSVVKSVSVAKDFAGFCCHDFDISTIVATGSEKLLRPVQFRNADIASTATAMSNVIKMFDNHEEAIKTSVS